MVSILFCSIIIYTCWKINVKENTIREYNEDEQFFTNPLCKKSHLSTANTSKKALFQDTTEEKHEGIHCSIQNLDWISESSLERSQSMVFK